MSQSFWKKADDKYSHLDIKKVNQAYSYEIFTDIRYKQHIQVNIYSLPYY